MIILDNISKVFETPAGSVSALQNISLRVNPGQIYGIIGKSGAGKSTLIRTVNLLERPSQGKVFVDQQELTALSSDRLRNARRKIGMIFQHFNLLSSRTVFANVALPLELAGLPRSIIKQKVMALLDLTGLSNKTNSFPSQLSGGQKQRVAIARALASDPKVLLSDEATSALDPETTATILQLLKDIRDRLNITILLITHEMSVIKNVCNRVGILEHGRLIEENEIGEFFTHPKTLTAKTFITSSLTQKLPATIANHVLTNPEPNTHPVLRLWFFGGAATEPIMAQLINQYQLRINILQANLEYINQHAMGIMTLAIDGEKTKLQTGVEYLRQIGIQVEVLGYVPNNVIPFA